MPCLIDVLADQKCPFAREHSTPINAKSKHAVNLKDLRLVRSFIIGMASNAHSL